MCTATRLLGQRFCSMNIGHISGVASYPSIITINSIGHLTGMALYPCGMHCIGDLGLFVYNGIAHGIFLSRQLAKIVSKFVFTTSLTFYPDHLPESVGPNLFIVSPLLRSWKSTKNAVPLAAGLIGDDRHLGRP